jgi:7-cyano-7-deazaguanine synthase
MKKKVIIVSGGMDSVTLLWDVVNKYGKENIEVLSFNYGSKHNAYELPMAKKNCEILGVKHNILHLEDIFKHFKSTLLQGGADVPEGHYAQDNMKQTIVPNRNSILLSIAVGLAESIEADTVFYGAHGGDHHIYEDCRPEFIQAFSLAEQLGTMNKIRIEAPYTYMNKISIIAQGLKLGVDYKLTHTCYKPNEKGESCGNCGSCSERLEAFAENKITDPLTYYR